MPHHKARLHRAWPRGGCRSRYRQAETFAQAAAWANVSASTVWESVRSLADRQRRRAPVTGLPAGAFQPAAPIAGARAGRGGNTDPPEASPDRLVSRDAWPTSSVARTRPCIGCCNALAAPRQPRPERPAVVRYERPCPGNLLHMDTDEARGVRHPRARDDRNRSQRSRRAGWEFVHSIVDDCSRLAYSEIHDDERAPTVTAFTERALAFSPERRHLLRAGDDRQRVRLHPQPLTTRAARCPGDHPHPHPALHTPHQRQGRRYQQTLQREWAYALPIRLKRCPTGLTAHTGCTTTTATHSQRARQPPSHPTRSGGHRAQQLAPGHPQMRPGW